jgi:hypothetical protein
MTMFTLPKRRSGAVDFTLAKAMRNILYEQIPLSDYADSLGRDQISERVCLQLQS